MTGLSRGAPTITLNTHIHTHTIHTRQKISTSLDGSGRGYRDGEET